MLAIQFQQIRLIIKKKQISKKIIFLITIKK
jgi:hypothetical protein